MFELDIIQMMGDYESTGFIIRDCCKGVVVV